MKLISGRLGKEENGRIGRPRWAVRQHSEASLSGRESAFLAWYPGATSFLAVSGCVLFCFDVSIAAFKSPYPSWGRGSLSARHLLKEGVIRRELIGPRDHENS